MFTGSSCLFLRSSSLFLGFDILSWDCLTFVLDSCSIAITEIMLYTRVTTFLHVLGCSQVFLGCSKCLSVFPRILVHSHKICVLNTFLRLSCGSYNCLACSQECPVCSQDFVLTCSYRRNIPQFLRAFLYFPECFCVFAGFPHIFLIMVQSQNFVPTCQKKL